MVFGLQSLPLRFLLWNNFHFVFMKNIFKWFLVIGFFIVLVFFLTIKRDTLTSGVEINSQLNNLEVNKIQYVKIAEVTLKVDLALTSKAQEQGLSGRKELKENEGMLFVFDHIGKYSFWMKDMNFPLDIIWIGEDMRVIYIKKNALPESYPEAFTPSQDARYVLEVISSFSQKNNLKKGDKVEFLPS
jgi:uncharacterized protein